MKQKITSAGTLIIGLLLAFGPQFIFKPCPTTEKFMKCFWSCKALIAIGTVIAIVALLQLIAKEKESKKLLSVTAIALLVFAILIPAVIIGGCVKPDMECKILTFPVTHSLSVIGILLQGIGLIGKKQEI